MNTLQEQKLIEEAKKGNQKAFTVLFNKYKNSLQYFVYLKVHNLTTAEDLTMEILSKAFCNINKYIPSDTAKFSTWLFRIANNHCLDFIRARYSRPTLISTTEEQIKAIGQVVDSKYANPEQIMISNQESDNILKHVDKLNPSYGKSLVMYSFEEMKYNEIAKKLGITISSVSGQVRLARRTLSIKLNKNKI